ncbi:MAG: anti-sigma F factor [Bacteroidia bacterium]
MTPAEEMIKEQTLSIASKSENIILVEKLINDICSDSKVAEDYYGNILVAVTEAVNNAIIHGNKSNPDKTVNLTVRSEDNHIEFIVNDQGEGFDYNNLPDPTNPENLEKPNGRGVFLMKHLADNVEFKDNGRTVFLEFNISQN